MTKKKPVKDKIKEKAAAVKAKLKGAKPAAAKCCILAALSLALVGCLDTAPASRATTASYRIEVAVKVADGARGNTFNVPFTIGDGALASADSAGSTETQTATPTMDVKPDIDVEVPVNKSGGGAQSVGSVLGDAVATGIGKLMEGGGKTGAAASATTKAAAAATTCADGSCTDGACVDGACNPQ